MNLNTSKGIKNNEHIEQEPVYKIFKMANKIIEYCFIISKDNMDFKTYMLNLAAKFLVASFSDENGKCDFTTDDLHMAFSLIESVIDRGVPHE